MSNNAAKKDSLADWRTVKIVDAYRFTKKPKELKPSKSTIVPFIPMDLVPQGGNTKIKYIKKTIGDIASGTYFERGDILLSKITPSFENGKQGIADEIENPYGYASTEIIPIHAIEGESSRHFLFYYLLDSEVRHQIAERMEGSTGRQRVPEPLIKEWLIPLPPVAEQNKIASILWKIQQAIEVDAELIRVSRELKAAVMKKLFTAGLNGEPQKETEIGLVPESWTKTRLVDFVLLQRGFDITKKEQISGNIPVVSSGGISSYHNVAKVKGPGVVVGRKGSVGTVQFLTSDFWAHDTTLYAKDFFGNDPKFVFYQLGIMNLKQYDSGASNPTLNRNLIQDLPVYVPSAKEQIAIVAMLDSIEEVADLHERKKLILEELFRSTLSSLMSASIRVTDLDIDTTCLESQGVAA